MKAELRISDAEVEAALSVEDFLASCDAAFRLYGSGVLQNPPRRETVRRDGDADFFRLELPGEWPGRYRARKVIEERSDVATGRLGARTATVELEEVPTGRRAVLDAEFLTNMRTGAAGALGVRYLGRSGIVRVAILGTGRIGRALALCVDRAVRPAQICATSRRAESRASFEATVGPRVSAAVTTAESVRSCIEGADAILAAVPTPRPILGPEDVAGKVHLSVMGGDARTIQVRPDLLRSRRVVVDHPDQVRNSGAFRVARSEGWYGDVGFVRDAAGRVQTIGDAALGRLERLRGTGAIAYFTGMAAQDLHAAVTVCRRIAGWA